tara:strand:+ start:128 stop:355 length:228 start_codon:yes stop_codon:yes gene_type:complete
MRYEQTNAQQAAPQVQPDSAEARVSKHLGVFASDNRVEMGFKSASFWRQHVVPTDYEVFEGDIDRRYAACVASSP